MPWVIHDDPPRLPMQFLQLNANVHRFGRRVQQEPNGAWATDGCRYGVMVHPQRSPNVATFIGFFWEYFPTSMAIIPMVFHVFFYVFTWLLVSCPPYV